MLLSEAFRTYDVELYADGKKLRTRKNYQCTLNTLLRCFGDLPVEFITYNLIIDWKLDMARHGSSANYIKSCTCHIRNVFRYLSKHGVKVIDYREIDVPKVKPRNPTWLTIEEVQRFMGVIESPRDKALFACLFSSAARIGEIMQLNRGDIVNGEAEIIGKGDKPGTLYFDDNALKSLDEYLDTRLDKLRPMFLSGHYRRLTVSRVEQLAHTYSDLAGIEKNVTPHVFRHSRASNYKLNGADIYDIQKQLRHSSISTTQIYTHIETSKLKADHKRFGTPTPI